jgi:predicted Co/Zn/Cd cation transporter (cation efflux family)
VSHRPRDERRALVVSVVATAAHGVVAIAWGVAAGSQMILFDGLYATVGLVASSLMLLASAVAERPPTRRYPYGRAAATPLVIGVQGSAMLATLLYGAIEAVYTIRAGGSDVVAGHGIPYGVVAAAASSATWAWLRRVAGSSDLVRAEATAWLVGAGRGVGIVAGFALVALLDGTSAERLAPYVDPAMVLLTCALLLPAPLGMVRANVVELLEGAPSSAVEQPVLAAAAELAATFDLVEPDVRVAKVGGRLYVEVEARAPSGLTLADEHALRTRLRERLVPSPYEVWLTVELLPIDAPGTQRRSGGAP